MKKFVPQESNNEKRMAIIIAFCFIIGLIVFGLADMSQTGMLVVGLCVLSGLIVLVLERMTRTNGLYIDGDKITFKVLKEKEYSIADIEGVMVLPRQIQGGHTGFRQLIRIKTKEYTIVYLKGILPEFYVFDRGHMDFQALYRKYVLFDTVYDIEIIEYLKTKNVPIINHVQIN